MTYGPGAQAYTQTQVSTTTNQKQLIVMAYDGVLRFLRQGKAHLAKKEVEEKIRCFERARAIIEELAGTLNMEKGGQIATNLWNLYVFFLRKITETNMTNDPSHVDEIEPIIQDLRNGWAEMQIAEDDTATQALNTRVPAADEAHRLTIMG